MAILRSFLIITLLLSVGGCVQTGGAETEGFKTPKADALPAVELEKILPGLWLHTSYQRLRNGVLYPSNGIVVRDGEHLLLVDPAWGAEATKELLARIQLDIGLPVKHAISTHFHGDRTLGVDVLEETGVAVFAHPLTAELAAAKGNPVPEHVFSDLARPGSHLTFGSVEVFYPGAAHARDNIMVWLPGQKVLYGGCALRELSAKSLGNVKDADLSSWPVAVQRAKDRYSRAKLVVPGHGEVGSAELFDNMLQLFDDRK